MLHAIDTTGSSKSTNWCGPSALSVLTGQPIVRSNEQLTRIGGGTYDELEGVHSEHVIIALHEHGYGAECIDVPSRYPELTHGPTLQRFLRDRTVTETVMPMLIEISGHFVCAHFGYAVDNWTMRPVEIKAFPKLQRLTKQAWTITPKGDT